MQLFKLSFICLLIVSSVSVTAQEFDSEEDYFNYFKYGYKHPEIGINFGVSSFTGDLTQKGAHGLELNQGKYYGLMFLYPLKSGGILLNANRGNFFSHGQVSSSIRSIKTTFTGASLSYRYEMRKTGMERFVPFVSAGIGYDAFSMYSDIYSASGDKYYYWSDGTIRDMPESYQNAFVANSVSRDYDYETDVVDSLTTTSGALFVPMSIGGKWNVNPRWNFTASYDLKLYLNDNVDKVQMSGGMDMTHNLNVSISYKLGAKSVKDIYQDYETWKDTVDTDRDGVFDFDDICAYSPPGVKVDKKGCPLDKDKDGVPDYLDKESNTPKNVKVYSNGVQIEHWHYEAMYILHINNHDSLYFKDPYSDSLVHEWRKYLHKHDIEHTYKRKDLPIQVTVTSEVGSPYNFIEVNNFDKTVSVVMLRDGKQIDMRTVQPDEVKAAYIELTKLYFKRPEEPEGQNQITD